MKKTLENLSDDEIDALLLMLFTGTNANAKSVTGSSSGPRSIREFSHEELLRIRSRNHPDKWPNVNAEAYQAAVEELDRRRKRSLGLG